MLCRYADVFGPPRTGVHSYRLFDVALVDAALAVLLALFLVRRGVSPVSACLGTFVAGVVAHRLFCVRTKVDSVLFPDRA